jgi:hypothetical protein
MKQHAIGLLLLGTLSTTAVADNLDIDLRDKAFRGSYSTNISGKSGLSAEFGVLTNEDTKQLNDTLYYAGLLVTGENWSKSGTFNISLGGKTFYTSPSNWHRDLSAIAFGGDIRFSPVHRLGIGGSFYYAPEITSFMDCKKYTETNLRVDYQVLPQAFVYANYRNIEMDVKYPGGTDTGVEVDKGLSIGMKLLF